MEKQHTSVPKRPFYRKDPIVVVLLALGVSLLSQIVAAIIIGFYPALQAWTEEQAKGWLETSITAQFIYTLIASGVAVYFVLGLIKQIHMRRSQIGLVKPVLKDIGYALGAYAAYFLVYLVVLTVLSSTMTAINTEQKQNIGFDNAYSSAEVLMTFLALVVIVPISEEVIFRGYLFTGLRAKYKFGVAMIITSVLFGVLHLEFFSGAPLLWIAAVDTFILSCFLCYIREKSGSLFSPILLHGIKNMVAFFLLYGSRIL